MLIFWTFGTIVFGERRLRPGRRAIGSGTITVHRAPALHRRHRQERPVPAPRLAAGRHGRPDPGLGPDPRRDDGHGRHLHGRPLAPDLHASPDARCWSSPIVGAFTAFMAATIALTQNDIKRVVAYSTVSQLGYMVFALGVGAWVAGHLPPDDPRLLQGPALPRLRLRHPRHARRAGHPEDGRAAEVHADHLLDLPDRALRQRRHRPARRVLDQGRDHRRRLDQPTPDRQVMAIVGFVAAFFTASTCSGWSS